MRLTYWHTHFFKKVDCHVFWHKQKLGGDCLRERKYQCVNIFASHQTTEKEEYNGL